MCRDTCGCYLGLGGAGGKVPLGSQWVEARAAVELATRPRAAPPQNASRAKSEKLLCVPLHHPVKESRWLCPRTRDWERGRC